MVHRNAQPSGRPGPGEFADYAAGDIASVDGDSAVAALEAQAERVLALLDPLCDEEVAGRAYAPGKWTVKEVVGHMIDDERIFMYRVLCVARGDARELPGFDEKAYVGGAGFEALPLANLVAQYRATRESTITLLRSLTPEQWLRRGQVNGYEASVRGLAFHVAGHELRHLRALQSQYGLG